MATVAEPESKIKSSVGGITRSDGEIASASSTESKTRSDVIVPFSQDDSSTDHVDGKIDDSEMPASQVSLGQSLSQTDEAIRRLQRDGALNQVVGSQSLLSQELISSSQRTEATEDGNALNSIQLSQQTETSVSMARRLGLLTQEEKEEPDTQRSLSQSAPVVVERSPPASVPSSQVTTLSDTPIRQSECFGSLLDAVERITREEEMNAKMVAWQYASGSQSQENAKPNASPEAEDSSSIKKSSSATKRKLKLPKGNSKPDSPKKSRKSAATRKKEQEQRESQEIAKRAAALAEQTITDPEMAKKLLLSMALVRENPRSVPTVLPPRGAVVPEGFFWAHYPPLEAVLKEHMAMYYELSTTKCQSAHQQAFNNELVVLVRDVAKNRGWRFHQAFSDKGLRDRIRCYYKTHIQNAKKRLRTMVRNPTKRANARHLCAHLDLIQQHGSNNTPMSSGVESDNSEGGDTTNRAASNTGLQSSFARATKVEAVRL